VSRGAVLEGNDRLIRVVIITIDVLGLPCICICNVIGHIEMVCMCILRCFTPKFVI
jgi:hypothetical protein